MEGGNHSRRKFIGTTAKAGISHYFIIGVAGICVGKPAGRILYA